MAEVAIAGGVVQLVLSKMEALAAINQLSAAILENENAGEASGGVFVQFGLGGVSAAGESSGDVAEPSSNVFPPMLSAAAGESSDVAAISENGA